MATLGGRFGFGEGQKRICFSRKEQEKVISAGACNFEILAQRAKSAYDLGFELILFGPVFCAFHTLVQHLLLGGGSESLANIPKHWFVKVK